MIKDIPGLIAKVTSELREFADFGVVGLSGGADSTLVAILCKRAFSDKGVYGVHMPHNEHDYNTFNSRSVSLAKRLGIGSGLAPISKISDAIIEASLQSLLSGSLKLSQVNEGNARSRARMCVLYTIAHELNDRLKKKVRVMGTGNMSEDFPGYDTKGGDALCDIFPLGTLFKSEVYQLLEHFRDSGEIDEVHIDRIPSAGLWAGQTDEQELGYSYNAMEPVIRKALDWEAGKNQTGLDMSAMPKEDDITKFVMERHFANKHKHEAPTVINLRQFCD